MKTKWLSLFFLFSLPLSAEVIAIYLSWYGDPTTTMTIQWICPEKSDEEMLLFEEEGAWHSVDHSQAPLHFLSVHAAHLKSLKPNTDYRFRIGDKGLIHTFRTAPAQLETPLHFVIGGDLSETAKLFRQMNRTVAAKDPLFAVLGGDLAYAITPNPFRLRSTALNKWVSFLEQWYKEMVSPEGRLIPFLLLPGNHDLSSDRDALFFSFFAFPQKQLYRAIDFGLYLSLILLDTDHVHPIEGAQTLWLNQTLSERVKIPHCFPVYHQAAYPSFYSYQGAGAHKIRLHWCPLFDKYHLRAAFEHHNHALKRTHPLRANRIDSEGTLYFGDGCWGAAPRKTNNAWYLAKRGQKNNVYWITLTPEKALIQAIGLSGEVLDEVSLPAR